MTEENIQDEDFSLYSSLQALDSDALYELIQHLLRKKPELYQLALEWFKERLESEPETLTEGELISLNDDLLFEYWEDARVIISEFNELGGGPEEDEDEAYESMNKILELAKKIKFSTDAIIEFLDEVFEEYNLKNSGFEDLMMEVSFAVCRTEEEWKYLIKKLEEHPSDWRINLIMRINKNHLRNDSAYLEERLKDLEYGMDYWDLVKFYIDRDDMEKALETAEEGLKAKGRIEELLVYLAEHYAEKRDTSNLERIVNTALAHHEGEKKLLDRLSEYYKSEGDFEKAKNTLFKAFEFTSPDNYYAEYRRMEAFLSETDWKALEPEIFNRVRIKNFNDYLRICLDKGMKETVIEAILNYKVFSRESENSNEYNLDKFAEELLQDYPEKVLEYYWQKARKGIPCGNRSAYSFAARYLQKAKEVYINNLEDEAGWTKRFSDLKAEFKNRRAFIDEVKML
ncbi:MAG: hypothetical protein PHV51_00495 [Methanosarcinaceae archaeon]|nr:hypothetical protein [Methanosarcinaceae archaeon]MDD4496625.1 hypothetical protein [Methanosarcinaceae archaeon]